jgi:hypothetical protein
MPFGIPSSEDDAYGQMISGIELNTADLTRFGTQINASLQAAGAANATDLRRPLNRLNQQLTRGTRANQTDLGNVAQSIAMQLAAGAQANAIDLARVPPPSRRTTFPVWYLYRVPNVDGPCDYRTQVLNTTEEVAYFLRGGTAYDVLGGPFPTEAAASQAGREWARAQPGCDGGPPANNIINGNIGGNGTTTPTRVWYVIRVPLVDQPCEFHVMDCNDAATCRYFTDPTLLAIAGWVVIAGPLPTFEAATAAGNAWAASQPICQTHPTNGNGTHTGNGTICPPPECPPCDVGGNGEIDLGLEKQVQCPSLDWLTQLGPIGNVIPNPGSQQFCRFLAEMDGLSGQVVTMLYDWMDQNLTTDALRKFLRDREEQAGTEASWLQEFLNTIPGAAIISAPTKNLMDAIVKLLFDFLEYIFTYAAKYLDAILCFFKNVRDFLRTIRFDCFSASIFMFVVARWILAVLKDWQLGTDFIVWAVDWVHIDFGPFEHFLDLLIAWAMPVEVPSVPEATRAWMMGQIETDQRDCVWRLNGMCPTTYAAFAMSESEHLSADEVIRFGHRTGRTDQDIDAMLSKRGWLRTEDRAARQELFWEIPTINDHLQWLRRNVDDHDYVQRFGLLDGFAPDEFIRSLQVFGDYQTLTDPHGRNFWRAFGPDLTAQGMKPIYAAYHYAAHWVQPSPEQMKEFIYRLRPDEEEGIRGFTVEDFKRILAEQDYAPMAVSWFADTVYRVPALTYIIGMYRNNVIGDEELKGYHQDLGYTPTDSDRFVGVDKLIKAKMRTIEYKGWTPTALASAFVTGRMSHGEVVQKLARIGGTEQEAQDLEQAAQVQVDRQVWQRARSRLLTRTATQVTQGLTVGVLTQDQAVTILRGLGYPEMQARGVVEAEAATSRTAVVRQTVQAVRRALHGGFILRGQADSLLEESGINADKRLEYLALWDVQNTPSRKRRTASQIVADLSQGMMDTEEATFRLQNLGYDNADTLLYLADAQRKVIARQAHAQAAAARGAAQQAYALQRLQRQAELQARQLRSELNRIAPRSVLIKWMKEGIINVATFRQRMERLGYPDDDIARYAMDAPTKPTVKELQQFVKDQVMNDAEFARHLRELGFSDRDIDYFLRDAHHGSTSAGPAPTAGPTSPVAGRGGGGLAAPGP